MGQTAQSWFLRLESWSRDVLRLVFQSRGLCHEHFSLGLGLLVVPGHKINVRKSPVYQFLLCVDC